MERLRVAAPATNERVSRSIRAAPQSATPGPQCRRSSGERRPDAELDATSQKHLMDFST